MPSAPCIEGHLDSFDGTRLFYEWRPSCGAPAAALESVFILIHGLGEHQGRYGRLKELLASAGASVLSYDQRGHGRSQGVRGYAPGLLYFVQDLLRMAQHALSLEASPSGRVSLLGHSFGGLVAALFALEFPERVEQLILSSPAFQPRAWIPFPRLTARLLVRLCPSSCITYPIFPVFLTHDREHRRKLEQDPLRHPKIGVKVARDMIEYGLYAIQNAATLSCPLLLLQAGCDLVVSGAASLQFFDRAGSGLKRKEVFQGMFHEIFNERESECVYRALSTFLFERNGAGA